MEIIGVGKPPDQRVVEALRRQAQDEVRHRRPAQVVNARYVEPPPVRVHKRSPGDLSTPQAMVRALAFIAALTIPGVTLLIVAIMFVAKSLTAENLAAVGGGIALVFLVLLFAANRAGHSGACPGFVVHCRGCRH